MAPIPARARSTGAMNVKPTRGSVRMKRGRRASSPSTSRNSLICWVSALSVTAVSFHTASRSAPLVTSCP